MDKAEIFILNRYAASELAGALLLGRMARKVDDPYLRSKLTWHCAEEARHATVWDELITSLEVPSLGVHDKENKSYFSYYSEVKDIIDFLAFVHIYELRVPFHFALHKKWTKDPRVKEVLTTLIKEEGSHLSWIRDILLKEMSKDKDKVQKSLQKFVEIEETTYLADLDAIQSLGAEGERFASLVREALPRYRRVLDDEAFR